MTQIVWDQVGDRIFQAGLDRGVLYLADRSGIAWNGLRSVVESVSGRVLTPLYFDGVKFGDSQILGEFSGVLSAITYPDEFLEYEGAVEDATGMILKNQPLKRFHLSYRTLLGDGLVGLEMGYEIHILYNLMAIPRDMASQTITNTTSPLEFGWTISSVPEILEGYNPVSHVILDSRKIDPLKLRDLESLLYGTETIDPFLPPLGDLKTYLEEWVGLTITDNGDGTWTAEGSENFIHMESPTEFRITDADADYLDSTTYQVRTGSEED